MTDADLTSASELAALRRPKLAGESASYSAARTALLEDEIELARQMERVASRRRELPDGPVIDAGYAFIAPSGEKVGLADLFGRHNTLIVYFWMYGPERERPCPMCTNLLGPLDANAADLEQQVALAVLGRSTVERQKAFAVERGWRHLKFYQTCGDDFARDFGGLSPDDGLEYPVLAVFRREERGGEPVVRLFWMGERSGEMADPGLDPRGGPDPAPLWTMLDLTPDGRGSDWYPKLEY